MAECWCRTYNMVCFSCYLNGARSKITARDRAWWDATSAWQRMEVVQLPPPPKKLNRRLKKVALKKEARKLLESLKVQYPLLNHL